MRTILPLSIILWGVCFTHMVRADILFVGRDEQFQEIKGAVDAAQAFDTVLVKPGTYMQHTIIIDKPLFLIGEHKPTLDAGNENVELIVVTADSVVIEGFVLANVGVSYLHELAAIKVKHSRYGVVRNNDIVGCYFGIYLEYAQDYRIEHNSIAGQADDEASAGNAIHAWKAKNLEIVHNTVTSHRDGIYFEFVDHSIIQHNQSFANLRYGLHFMFSNDDYYRLNEFRENGAGVAVMFSKKIRMEENLFTKNWGGAAYGLLLKEISDGEITHNRFVRNTIGILAEGANRILIDKNQFTLNGTALDIKGNCLDNQILKNNFLANTFEVVTNTQHNNNYYDRNYWSGYTGYDLNCDGIGDEPYRPVNLFARITNEIPSATIMLHSFFVNLLELSERVFPNLIPAALVDQHPRLRPYPYD